MTREYVESVAEVKGVKLATDAMKACGMQPEFAAHLMLQSQSMGVSVILRAGSPPVYNQKRGPKTGFNLTKTSTQGLFRGSLAADVIFTRIDDKTRHGKGHDPKDAKHLALSIHEPDYQHTVALPITMQDILREVGPQGDLVVLGYENGKLRLAYKEGKGDVDFHGQFVIDLNKGDKTPMFYSRPWDRPDHHPDWDPNDKVIRKPEALADVPDDVYKEVFNQSFTVNYSHQKVAELQDNDIIPAKVFANTPRTSSELRSAILKSGVLDPLSDAYQQIQAMNESALPVRSDILNLLTVDEIKAVYDTCALVTTGDWDGLALGHPPGLMPEFEHVYNTFSVEHGHEEIEGLLKASVTYFNYLKAKPDLQGTPLGVLLASIEEPASLFSEFALSRAGCITPHEFLYQQLINYAYRDAVNSAYGNTQSRDAMQIGMNIALVLAESISGTPEEKYQACFVAAQKAYDEQLEQSTAWRDADMEHFSSHLRMALDSGVASYLIPNISHDHNVHDLFQHGFDMRNPYGSNLEGAWVIVTNEGGVIYGDKEEQLIEVLLIEGFLEKNVISVSHGANMDRGWGEVVQRQIELGQSIPAKTMEKYQNWVMSNAIEEQKGMKELLQQAKGEQATTLTTERAQAMRGILQTAREGEESVTSTENLNGDLSRAKRL